MHIYFKTRLFIFDLEPGNMTDNSMPVHKTEFGDYVIQAGGHALILTPFWSDAFKQEQEREAERAIRLQAEFDPAA